MSSNRQPSFIEMMAAVQPRNLGVVGSFKLPSATLEGSLAGTSVFASVEIEVPIEALLYVYPGGGYRIELRPAGFWGQLFEADDQYIGLDSVSPIGPLFEGLKGEESDGEERSEAV